jgi:hypothetical protein
MWAYASDLPQNLWRWIRKVIDLIQGRSMHQKNLNTKSKHREWKTVYLKVF